jgi:hypothetical protein
MKKDDPPEYEAKPTKVSILIDCRQCKLFIWKRMSCAATYSCVNGSQYKPSNFIQIFRE